MAILLLLLDIDPKSIFENRNRGLLFDGIVFVFQLTLIRFLTTLAVSFVRQAEQDAWAKTAIGLFLIGLFVLQPLGPILKRWSFHQHFSNFENQQSAFSGCLLSIYRFFYITAMCILIYLSYSYFIDAFPNLQTIWLENSAVAVAIVLAVVSVITIFHYFRKPKNQPRWKFLMTPQAEVLGDFCMILNVICFQMVFSVYIASPHFWNVLHKITRQSSGGFFDGLSGRLYVAGIAVLLAYLPARIFYLVIERRRKVTWLVMLLANVPFILAITFYVPEPQQLKSLREPAVTITAAEIHNEYEVSHQEAMKKYRGKVVNVTGRVQTRFLPQSLELDDEIGLDGSDGYPWVYCAFDEDQVEIAEGLEMGQLVTLQCVGSESWSRGPVFKHCILVSATDTEKDCR